MIKTSRYTTLLIIIVLAVLVVGGIVAYKDNSTAPGNSKTMVPTLNPTQKAVEVPKEQSLEGIVLCLPHKDTNGPQTMECAFGLQTDDGKNYALDAGNVNPPQYNTGNRIRANGTITPIEALSSDHWQKYDIIGIFSIKDSVEVL